MKRITLFVCLLMVVVIAVVACAAPTPVTVKETVQVPVQQTVTVKETVQVPVQQTVQVKETVQVTVKETVAVPVVVTATPPPTAAPKKGGTLIAARAVDATGLDPHKQTAFSSFRMLELIYDPLLAFDKDLKIVPNLAEAWKWSEDGKTLTVTLRKNVKFHNGDPMTSDDVKFSFDRILDEKTGAAARASFTDIDKVEAKDPTTAVFTLKKVNPSILAAMTNPNSAIISKKLIGGGADPAKEVVGTGAFKLTKWEPDRTLTMAANKDFWIPGLPRIDGIEFRTIPDEASILAGLRAKTLDWSLINDPRVAIRAGAGGSTLNISRAPALAYHVLQLNASRPIFTDVKVRQAIACAIDRQEVLDTASLGEGEVTSPATPPYYRANLNDLTCYKKDVEKSKQLLSEAKVTGLKFKLMADTGEPPTSVAEAQNIQAQLKKIGVETEIEVMEHSVYVDRWLKGDFDAVVALNGGNPDPDIMFYRYWHSTGNLNKVAAYSNPEIDKLLDQGRAIADPEKRKPIYNEVQKKLADAAPWVWLYVSYEYRVMQPYVKGFTPLPNGSLIYLRDTWLDK